jgi:hypothetical protein
MEKICDPRAPKFKYTEEETEPGGTVVRAWKKNNEY